MVLSLGAPLRIGDGPVMSEWHRPWRYPVRGLPAGQQAWVDRNPVVQPIAWIVRRDIHGEFQEWTGDYRTPEAGLAALQSAIDRNA